MGADATARPDHLDRWIPPVHDRFVPRCRLVSAYQAPHDPTDVIAKRYVAAVIDFVIELVVWAVAFVIAYRGRSPTT